MTTDLMSKFAEDERAGRMHAADLVAHIAQLNEAIGPLAKAKELATEELKQYMGLNGLYELEAADGLAVARLTDTNGTPSYDLVTLAKETDGYALIEAASAGMLRVDHTALDRFRKNAGATWADVIDRFKGPGTGTTRLTVERPK